MAKLVDDLNQLRNEYFKKFEMIMAIEKLLRNMPEEDAAFRNALTQISVIFAYLKRYSNLLLQADERKNVCVSDLRLCRRLDHGGLLPARDRRCPGTSARRP